MDGQVDMIRHSLIATGVGVLLSLGWGVPSLCSAQGTFNGASATHREKGLQSTTSQGRQGVRSASHHLVARKLRSGSGRVDTSEEAELAGPGGDPGARHAHWEGASANAASSLAKGH